MSDIFEQFKKVRSAHIADQAWLKRNKEVLLSRIEHEPQAQLVGVQSDGLGLLGRLMHPAPMATVAVVVLVALVGINSNVQNKLPGDRLYFWKRATEQATLALKNNGQDKIAYQIELVGKRYNEIAELSQRSDIEVEELTQATNKAEQQLKDTEQEIEKLATEQGDEDQALDATVKLSATVKAQKKVIDRLEDTEDEPEVKKELEQSAQSLEDTSEKLDEKSKDLSEKKKQDTTTKATTDPDLVKKEVEQEVEKAKEQLDQAQQKVEDTPNGDILTGEAKDEVQDATDALDKAQEALENDDIEEALDAIQTITESATNAEALTDTAERVSENVRGLLDEQSTPSPSQDPVSDDTISEDSVESEVDGAQEALDNTEAPQ